MIDLHTSFIHELESLIEEQEWVRKSKDLGNTESFAEKKLNVLDLKE